jgi:hypothetical protein
MINITFSVELIEISLNKLFFLHLIWGVKSEVNHFYLKID